MTEMTTMIVYTDGACLPNPGPGGWAWAVPGGKYASGSAPDSTNQRMELTAAWEALKALSGPLEIRSDSEYVVKCFNDQWYVGWESRDWRTSKKKAVENQDLWRPVVELFHKRAGELTFVWVKGHGTDPMNDMVDRLATEAASTQCGRSGEGEPRDLGPADAPRSYRSGSGGSTLSQVEGWRLIVIGHRPPQLGGYDPENPIAGRVQYKLVEILTGLKVVHPDLVVLTGLGLGAEMLGAEAAERAGVPYIEVQPFPDPEGVWPVETRLRYKRLAMKATKSVRFSAKKPNTKQAAGIAVGARDKALLAVADGAVVVWNGSDRNLGATVTALEKRLPDDVWVISPD